MTRARAAVILAGMLLGACKGNPSTSPPSPVEAAATTRIEIRPFTLTFGGQPIAKLLENGRTESVGMNPPGGAMSPGPTLAADGTITFAHAGHTGRLAADGKLYVTSPGATERLFATIADDRVVFADGKNGAHVTGDMITFDDGQDDVGKIEGPVDAAVRRTALVMFAAFMFETSLGRS